MTSVVRTNGTFTSVAEHKPKLARGTNPTYIYLQKKDTGVSSSSSDATDYIFVTFSSPVPNNVYVSSAVLELETGNRPWIGIQDAVAERVTSNWQASKIKYGDMPSVTSVGQVSGTFDTVPVHDIISFDVTSHIQDMANGTPFFGWRISTQSPGPNRIYGRGSRAPRLKITYAAGPSKPVQTHPGSATETIYISTGKPTLVTESNIFSAGVSIVSMQVQLSTASTTGSSGSFTSVAWDSGEFATTTSQAPLETLGAPEATNGNGYWWIARLKGTDGVWSPWSSPIKWFRKDLGTLTLNNPDEAPNNVVYQSMPLIDWSVAGMSQTSYQVSIYDASNNIDSLWDSDKNISTDTSITVPQGVITEVNKPYRVELKVWDSEKRQQATSASGVAPVYASVVRDFVYSLSTSVSGVSPLSLAVLEPKPVVKLMWSRPTDPDYFEISRDGVVIATNLSMFDVNKSGTDYWWIDYSPIPIKTHTWSVRAIESGMTSAINPEKSATTDTSMAWLIDPETGTMVPISGESPVDVGMYEKGNTYEPYKSLQPIRVTSAVGGMQGTASGTLCGECLGDGTTSEDLQNYVLSLRQEPGKVLNLLIVNIAIPVVVYNISTFPLYGPRFGKVYGVSFDWHEVKNANS